MLWESGCLTIQQLMKPDGTLVWNKWEPLVTTGGGNGRLRLEQAFALHHYDAPRCGKTALRASVSTGFPQEEFDSPTNQLNIQTDSTPRFFMFTGTYTAIVTPFKNGKIDEAADEACEASNQGGRRGVVPVGTHQRISHGGLRQRTSASSKSW